MRLLRDTRILRFALVGALTALSYVLLYLAFLAAGLIQPLANGIAFGLAVALQYLGQTRFTFRRPLGQPDQALRFAVMIGCGLMTSAVLTGLVAPALAMPHWVAAASVAGILPVQNYILMKLWVYSVPPHGSEV